MADSSILSIVAAIVSMAGALISFHNLRIASAKQKMEVLRWQREYFVDLLSWAEECLTLLSTGIHLCDLNPIHCKPGEFFDMRHHLRLSLSSKIDHGRWFFPNYENGYGAHKPIAFRGYRHEVLDSLVESYRLLTTTSYRDQAKNGPLRDLLVEQKRKFTSEIQGILNPRRRDEEFHRILVVTDKA
jgi:hypothetical protein